jgi:seryl-tRNA synthetase
MIEKSFQPERIMPETEALQARVEQLESQLKKEQPAISPEEEEKAVKKEIKGYLNEIQQISVSSLPLSSRDDAGEIKKFPIERQVEALVSLVFEKGLSRAVSVAKQMKNPAILDGLHDALVDEYFKEMVARKIIKP